MEIILIVNIQGLCEDYLSRDFPGSPVVKTLPSSAEGMGLISGRGARIPRASWPKNQNIKQKQYCNKLNKDFRKGPSLVAQKVKNLPAMRETQV